MFARITAGSADFPSIFGENHPENGFPIRVSLNEFSYKKGSEIFGEKEPADYVYQVMTGAVRSYKLLSDGRRQIGAFHLVGDIFGLEIGTDHRFTAEAIVDTTVRLMKRRSLECVAESDVVVARNLLSMTTSNLRHAEDHHPCGDAKHQEPKPQARPDDRTDHCWRPPCAVMLCARACALARKRRQLGAAAVRDGDCCRTPIRTSGTASPADGRAKD